MHQTFGYTTLPTTQVTPSKMIDQVYTTLHLPCDERFGMRDLLLARVSSPSHRCRVIKPHRISDLPHPRPALETSRETRQRRPITTATFTTSLRVTQPQTNSASHDPSRPDLISLEEREKGERAMSWDHRPERHKTSAHHTHHMAR